MKRRGFLGLLGLAPTVPLIAKELTQVRPATSDDHIKLIKAGLRETFPASRREPPVWELQPLDECMQPWMGLFPREAESAPTSNDGETDLSITLPQTDGWMGKPMPAHVRTFFMGKPVITMPVSAGYVPFGSITFIQRVNIS